MCVSMSAVASLPMSLGPFPAGQVAKSAIVGQAVAPASPAASPLPDPPPLDAAPESVLPGAPELEPPPPLAPPELVLPPGPEPLDAPELPTLVPELDVLEPLELGALEPELLAPVPGGAAPPLPAAPASRLSCGALDEDWQPVIARGPAANARVTHAAKRRVL
ncbi:MAG: hypothetical protein JOZ69_08120 [Myxococcales bacterium]|nr:hypothetical protein [Myxococcales bacterium]